MDQNAMIVEEICEGGSGGEAKILVQARNSFPGLGGVISSQQIVVAALRTEHSSLPGAGNELFLKHLIIKKLDDYFSRLGKYTYPHIARPLGSVSGKESKVEAYLYEWVYGYTGFPWEHTLFGGEREAVVLDEWNAFVGSFDYAGILMSTDITDPDNGRLSQNIIHQLYCSGVSKLNRCWKRIDLGHRSVYVEADKLRQFLIDNAETMKVVLGIARYELLMLAQQSVFDLKSMNEGDIGKLETLTRDYRLSTLRHHRPRIVIQ